jgi:CubicO group peptidase (beta-lactamase class C family)
MTGPSSSDVERAVSRGVAYAQEISEWTPVPGGVLAVVSRDGLLDQAAWGRADVAAGTVMHTDHRFEIGSISKVTTALLVHRLVEDGSVDLDRPVTELVPWLSFGEPAAPVTARHLLSHTGGLVLGADAVPGEAAQLWGMRSLVRSGTPGERFHYSNLGYMALGALASSVCGAALPELVADRVLEPIGMGTALPTVRHDSRAGMAVGHWPLHDDRPWVPGDPVTAATWFEVGSADGNVAASAAELGQLASFLLGDGQPLLTAESFDRLVSPSAPQGEDVLTWGATPKGEWSRYGLGINVEQVAGHHCVSHGGGMVGYATYLLADRDAGLGVVVLTNGSGEHPAAHVVARVVHRMLLHPQWRPPSAAGLATPGEVTAARTGRFAGTAADGTSLSVDVVADEQGVQVRHDGTRGRLLRTWSSRFATDHPRLRTFALTPTEDGWAWGPYSLVPADARPTSAPGGEELLPFAGHYRSWSPWWPQLRLVVRDGSLVLIASGGVEAPWADLPLVASGDRGLRIGADPWLPERLELGPVVEGSCVSVVRDGCVYSRTFTP